jgi:hypothetical protein
MQLYDSSSASCSCGDIIMKDPERPSCKTVSYNADRGYEISIMVHQGIVRMTITHSEGQWLTQLMDTIKRLS